MRVIWPRRSRWPRKIFHQNFPTVFVFSRWWFGSLGKPVGRWWFQSFFYFHPYLGKIPILTNIFQRGWNHQLVLCITLPPVIMVSWKIAHLKTINPHLPEAHFPRSHDYGGKSKKLVFSWGKGTPNIMHFNSLDQWCKYVWFWLFDYLQSNIFDSLYI